MEAPEKIYYACVVHEILSQKRQAPIPGQVTHNDIHTRLRLVVHILPDSLYRAARFANLEGILGFSVPSIIWVGVGLMQITMFERALPAWPAKTKPRMANEIAMVSEIFAERRR